MRDLNNYIKALFCHHKIIRETIPLFLPNNKILQKSILQKKIRMVWLWHILLVEM